MSRDKDHSSNPVDVLCDLDHYLACLNEDKDDIQSTSSYSTSDQALNVGDACVECRASDSPLILATTSGHKGCLREILSARENEKLDSERAENGATLAHIAARKADLESLRMIVTADSSLSSTGDVRGATPLHVCAHHGYVDCLSCLLDNEGSGDQQDFDGATPIHFAAASGHLECLKVLLEKGNSNTQTQSGETPVYYAAQEGHLDCVHWLVDHYRADPQIASNDGMTPLHAAAQTGRLNVTHWLVRSAGCPITCRTMDGATPIHFAAAKGHVAILEWMLHHSLATGLEQDDFGATPVHDAAEQGQLECLHVFYNHSVDLHTKDCEGLTPMDMAQEKQHKACVTFLQNPQQAFLEARKHKKETKDAEFRHLLTNEGAGSGGGAPEPKKRRKTFGGFLSKNKKKSGSSSHGRIK